MSRVSRPWLVVYCFGWVVGLATVTGFATALLVVASLGEVVAIEWLWPLGAVAGAVLGFRLARTTRHWRRLHRVLRALGALAVAAGLVGAFVMFAAAKEQHRTQPAMFAGLAELFVSLLGLLVAGLGACAWSVGFSAPRLGGAPVGTGGTRRE